MNHYNFFISLQDFYVNDVVQNTDHFHPLYFESMWEEIIDLQYEDHIVERAHGIMAKPYWNDRLYNVVK